MMAAKYAWPILRVAQNMFAASSSDGRSRRGYARWMVAVAGCHSMNAGSPEATGSQPEDCVMTESGSTRMASPSMNWFTRIASGRGMNSIRVRLTKASMLMSAATLILLLSARFTEAQLAPTTAAISGQAVTPFGGPAASAKVFICPITSSGVPCTPTAPLFSDYLLTHEIPNPISTDQYGNYKAFLTAGLYTVQVKLAGQSQPTFVYYTAVSASVGTGGSDVTRIIAGDNVTISSTGSGGTGAVTINSTGGGGGGCAPTGTGFLVVSNGSGTCESTPGDFDITAPDTYTIPNPFTVDTGDGVTTNNNVFLRGDSTTVTSYLTTAIRSAEQVQVSSVTGMEISNSDAGQIDISDDTSSILSRIRMQGGKIQLSAPTGIRLESSLDDSVGANVTIVANGGVGSFGVINAGSIPYFDVSPFVAGGVVESRLPFVIRTPDANGEQADFRVDTFTSSPNTYTIQLARVNGTMMLYSGSLTANDCAQVNATGDGFVDSGAVCGTGGGGSAFSALTSGSNTTAAMVVGTGASLGVAGTGTIGATSVGGITITGTPSVGWVPTATSSSAATWQAPAGGGFITSLTTTGSSGAATVVSGVLNIPVYSGGGGAFSAISTGTNTNATMTCGTGCSMLASGTGSIAATKMSTAGTTTTVLHGNASGNPTYGAVNLTTDVTGALPNANLANASTTVNGTTCTLGSTCTVSAAASWSALTNPSGNLALTMASNTTTFTFGASTGSADLFKWVDTASNVGTGILAHFTTASGSSENPWQADSNGLGWEIDSTGVLKSVGATASGEVDLGGSSSGIAAIIAQAAAGTPTLTLPTSTGTFATTAASPINLNSTTGQLSCASCVVSASSLTNNAVVIGGGSQTSSTISADTTTTHALFATAGAPAFRALAAGDLPIATTSAIGGVKADGTTIGVSSGIISMSGVGSGTATPTPGSGVTSVTCNTASCTNLRGTFTVVGGSFTTGTAFALAWPTTTTAYVCEVSQNGGISLFGVGNSVATATGMNVTVANTIAASTLVINYSCRP